MTAQRETAVDYSRVMIPKSESKYRPLGVPTLEWRIYLGLINKFLQLYKENEPQTYQHAFMPGRGTLTA